MKRIWALTALFLILMPDKAPAPIYGTFPGLNKLIDGAEFIVVAEIIKRPPIEEFDMGGGATFEIEVVKALKGNAKPGKRSTAYLRDLSFTIGPHDITGLTQGFIPTGRYLLFLNRPGTHTHDENGKPLPVDFENENCEGDAVWISSSDASPTGYFDLESLKGKSVRECVVALLNHAANEQRRFATAVGAMIESRAVNSLTQRVTQVLWFDNNAEEVANFYLSIFKDSRKDPNVDRYRDVVPELGNVAGVKLWIEGQDILVLNGGPKFKRTQMNIMTLNCDLQEEIDYYWEKLSAGGERSRGGWVKDKFGVWWHVVPTDLAQTLSTKDAAKAERVMKAMMQMDKIDSAALWRASMEK